MFIKTSAFTSKHMHSRDIGPIIQLTCALDSILCLVADCQ